MVYITTTPAQLLVRKSDQSIILANEQFSKLTNFKTDEIIGKRIHDLFIFNGIGNKDHITINHNYQKIKLKTRPELNNKFFYLSIKEISGIISRITVLTAEENKEGLDILLDDSEIFYHLLKFSPMVINKIGPDLKTHFINRLPTGYDYDTFASKKVTEWVKPEYKEKFETELRTAFNTQLASNIEITFQTNNTFDITIYPFLDSIILFGSDKTNMKKIEGELFDLSLAFTTMLNASPIGVAIMINQVFIFSNHRFDEFIGDDSEGKKIHEISFLNEMNFDQVLKQNEEEEAVLEIERQGLEGTEYYRIRYRKMKYFQEEAIIFHSEDISNFKQIQYEREQLIKQKEQSNRLESLGLLAGGIAHDFNNILTGIIANASLLELFLDDNQDANIALTELLGAAEQAKNLTHQLLSYTGRAQIKKIRVNLSETIKSSISMITSAYSSEILIETDLDKNIEMIADPTQINQVIINLVTNAVEAMPNGGKVRVKLHLHPKDEMFDLDYANTFSMQLNIENYIHISVKDEGFGIKTTSISDIFNPFFTSKSNGRGLGLSVVSGIIEAHNGGINVKSDRNGTEFNIFLPHYHLKSENDSQKQPNGHINGTNGKFKFSKILVVDDNQKVLNSMSSILQTMKIEHDLCSEPDKIFTMIQHQMYDLIIIDLTMPNHNTFNTVNILRNNNPKQNILLSSGFPYSETEQYTISDNIEFLQKPYSIRDVKNIFEKFQL